MDRLLGVQTKSNKKGNRKPAKVVYIDNPIMVKTSASDFMALVQELTGNARSRSLGPVPSRPNVDGSSKIVQVCDPRVSTYDSILGVTTINQLVTDSEILSTTIDDWTLQQVLEGFSCLESPTPLQWQM